MHKTIMTILVLFCMASATEVYNIKAADGTIHSKMNYNSALIWHRLSADAVVGPILTARGNLTAVEGTPFTPAVLTGHGSFKVGDDQIGFGCRNIDFNAVMGNKLTFKFDYDCYINLFDYNAYWWEQYDLLIAEDQLKLYDERGAQLKQDGYNLIKVGWDVGCLFRAGPSYGATPLARATAGTYIVVGPEVSANKGWVRVLLSNKEEGNIEAYVGRHLMTALAGEPTPTLHVKEPLKEGN